MIGIGIGIGIGIKNRNTGVSFTSQYQALYNSLTTPPSNEIAVQQNLLVKTLVEGGVWAKFDAAYLFAQTVNTASEALKNWKNPDKFNATIVGALTFTALEGFTGSATGLTNYIRSNYIPSSDKINYAQNSAAIGYYSRTNVAQDTCDMGVLDAGNIPAFLHSRRVDNSSYGRLNVNLGGTTPNDDSRGLFIITRTLSTHQDIYRNGTRIGNIAANSSGIPALEIAITCLNNNGVIATATKSTRQLSFAFISGGLTAADITVLTNAVEVYMDSNGKGVIA